MEIVALFCDIDDFCLWFEPRWRQQLLSHGGRPRWRETRLCLSEVMTIVVSFHQSGSRTCKAYFLRYVRPHLRGAFPHLVSYSRFVELMAHVLVPLCAYCQTRMVRSEGGAFIASTLLSVCHPKRSARHKVFAGLARWGRNSLGWGYGFNLHLVLNAVGDLLAWSLRSYLVLVQNDAITRREDALERPWVRLLSATGRLTRSLRLPRPGWSHVPMPPLHDIWEQALATSRRRVARRRILHNSPKTAGPCEQFSILVRPEGGHGWGRDCARRVGWCSLGGDATPCVHDGRTG
jgi:hypothetical protein